MQETTKGRMAQNVIVTYGRSLVSLVCGLVSGRWVLLTLGAVDYGILGLVGGLVAFVSGLNAVLSGAVARFYALAIGRNDWLECRRWFTVAVSIHAVLPLFLLAAGWPAGEFVVTRWLTIPADRLADAVWVWRFTCIGSFVNMVNVPFHAMFIARQRLGEISAYGALVCVLNVLGLYYMVTHPGVWLFRLAGWTCLMAVLPAVFIMVRATLLFGECRLKFEYLWNWRDMCQLGQYAGWMMVGSVGMATAGSLMAVVVNRMFGPARNAAFALSNSVSSHVLSLAAAVRTAFVPAVVSAYGAGEMHKVKALSYAQCVFGSVAVMVFAIPLALEMNQVLTLWLKEPPGGTDVLCLWGLVSMVITWTGAGFPVVLEANGRVAIWQMLLCAIRILSLPMAVTGACCGFGLNGVGMAVVTTEILVLALNLVLMRKHVGFSPLEWARKVLMPVALAATTALMAGALPRCLMPCSLIRLALTVMASCLALALMVWYGLMNSTDRLWVMNRLRCDRQGRG